MPSPHRFLMREEYRHYNDIDTSACPDLWMRRIYPDDHTANEKLRPPLGIALKVEAIRYSTGRAKRSSDVATASRLPSPSGAHPQVILPGQAPWPLQKLRADPLESC